jgi:hypothetical protein
MTIGSQELKQEQLLEDKEVFISIAFPPPSVVKSLAQNIAT